MFIGMPLDGSLFVRFFDICLSCVLVHAQNRVVVLALGFLNLDLRLSQLFSQAWGLRCHVFELIVFVQRLFPLLLVHLDVTFLQKGLHVLRVQRNRSIAISEGIVVLT